MSRPIYSSIDEALEDVARAYRQEPAQELGPDPIPAAIPDNEPLDAVRRRIISEALISG